MEIWYNDRKYLKNEGKTGVVFSSFFCSNNGKTLNSKITTSFLISKVEKVKLEIL